MNFCWQDLEASFWIWFKFIQVVRLHWTLFMSITWCSAPLRSLRTISMQAGKALWYDFNVWNVMYLKKTETAFGCISGVRCLSGEHILLLKEAEKYFSLSPQGGTKTDRKHKSLPKFLNKLQQQNHVNSVILHIFWLSDKIRLSTSFRSDLCAQQSLMSVNRLWLCISCIDLALVLIVRKLKRRGEKSVP